MTSPREYEMVQAATSRIIMMAMMTNMSIRFWAMAMQRLNPHYYAGLHPPPLPRSSSVPSYIINIIIHNCHHQYPHPIQTHAERQSPQHHLSQEGDLDAAPTPATYGQHSKVSSHWVIPMVMMSTYGLWSLGVDVIGDDDDLSHVYLPNFKQL